MAALCHNGLCGDIKANCALEPLVALFLFTGFFFLFIIVNRSIVMISFFC